MSLFKNFNISKFKSKKPPGDRSITTYSEIQQIKNIKADEKFVKEKDDIFNKDSKWNDEIAKKKLLEYFDLLGFNDPNVIIARKKLSSMMFK